MEKYYARGQEKQRLNTHRLEKERILAILKRWVPAAPAAILDVGDAAGAVKAEWRAIYRRHRPFCFV